MMTMTMIPDMKNTFRTLTSTFVMFSGLDLPSPSPKLLNSGMIISCQGLPLLWLCCQVRDESLSVPSGVGKWDC